MRGYRLTVPAELERRARGLVGQHVLYDNELFIVVGVDRVEGEVIVKIRKTRAPGDSLPLADVVADLRPSHVLLWPEDYLATWPRSHRRF